MSFVFRPAKREQVKVLLALAGSSGSGKTFSALKVAHGMAGGRPFALIDTENGRALHYAEGYGFRFDHGALDAPYTPARFLESVASAETAGYPVIVIDNFTHEWDGIGGCCDMQEAEVDRMAGQDFQKRERVKIAAWAMPKQEHRRLMARLLQCQAHLIFCLRADNGKIEMQRIDGKLQVAPKRLLGWASEWIPITEKRFIYEMTTSIVLSPDRPGYPMPIKLQDQHKAFFPLDQPITERAGEALAAWARGGESAGRDTLPGAQSPAAGPVEAATSASLGATSEGGSGGAPSNVPEPWELIVQDYIEQADAIASVEAGKGLRAQWEAKGAPQVPAAHREAVEAAFRRARARVTRRSA